MSHSARKLPLRHARRDKPTAASQPYAGGAPKTRRARAARASSGPQLWRRTIARMARLNALACQLLIRAPSEDEIDFSTCRIALFPKGYKNPDILILLARDFANSINSCRKLTIECVIVFLRP